MRYIKATIAFIFFVIASVFLGYRQGRQSIENETNKEVAESVKRRNKIYKDVARLSDSELDAELQKWQKAGGK